MRFIHIPKTGGTSIVNALGLSSGKVKKHGKYGKGGGRYRGGHDILCEYVPNTFTVVRNPFDRLVSSFCYAKTKNSFHYKEHPYYEYIADCDFERFVEILPEFEGMFQLRPQSDYIYDDKNNLLVDHVLRYETLQKDFNKFWDIKLPHLNKSDRHKDWRKYYNENTIKPVYEFYKRDFKNFNYDTRTKRLG